MIDLSTRIGAVATLFQQAPGVASPAAIDPMAQLVLDATFLLLNRQAVDVSRATGGFTAIGFWGAAGGVDLVVPAGKSWLVLGMTATVAPTGDTSTFYTCIANAAGLPLWAEAARHSAASPGSAELGAYPITPTLLFLKPGDQIGVWVSTTGGLGLSVATITARIVEFDFV